MSALEPKQRPRVRRQVDEMIWSLNWMHGESHRPATVTKRVKDDAKAGRLQSQTRQRLEERERRFIHPQHARRPRRRL